MLPPATPLRFSSTTEKVQDDEATTNAELVEQLLKISQITYADGHKALRSVHAKSHGILKGRLTVADDLPPVLAQGLFSAPGDYPATLRFSTSPGDLLPDSISLPRGVAIKLEGVSGELLAGTQGNESGLPSDHRKDIPCPRFQALSQKPEAVGIDHRQGRDPEGRCCPQSSAAPNVRYA